MKRLIIVTLGICILATAPVTEAYAKKAQGGQFAKQTKKIVTKVKAGHLCYYKQIPTCVSDPAHVYALCKKFFDQGISPAFSIGKKVGWKKKGSILKRILRRFWAGSKRKRLRQEIEDLKDSIVGIRDTAQGEVDSIAGDVTSATEALETRFTAMRAKCDGIIARMAAKFAETSMTRFDELRVEAEGLKAGTVEASYATIGQSIADVQVGAEGVNQDIAAFTADVVARAESYVEEALSTRKIKELRNIICLLQDLLVEAQDKIAPIHADIAGLRDQLSLDAIYQACDQAEAAIDAALQAITDEAGALYEAYQLKSAVETDYTNRVGAVIIGIEITQSGGGTCTGIVNAGDPTEARYTIEAVNGAMCVTGIEYSIDGTQYVVTLEYDTAGALVKETVSEERDILEGTAIVGHVVMVSEYDGTGILLKQDADLTVFYDVGMQANLSVRYDINPDGTVAFTHVVEGTDELDELGGQGLVDLNAIISGYIVFGGWLDDIRAMVRSDFAGRAGVSEADTQAYVTKESGEIYTISASSGSTSGDYTIHMVGGSLLFVEIAFNGSVECYVYRYITHPYYRLSKEVHRDPVTGEITETIMYRYYPSGLLEGKEIYDGDAATGIYPLYIYVYDEIDNDGDGVGRMLYEIYYNEAAQDMYAAMLEYFDATDIVRHKEIYTMTTVEILDYYASGNLATRFVSPPDADGTMSYEYLDEDFYGDGTGRITQTYTVYGSCSVYEYNSLDVNGSEVQTDDFKHIEIYDFTGALVESRDYASMYDADGTYSGTYLAIQTFAGPDARGAIQYSYYESGNVHTMVLAEADADGIVEYGYYDDTGAADGFGRTMRILKEDDAETYYLYFDETTIVNFEINRLFDSDPALFISIREYDTDGNLVAEYSYDEWANGDYATDEDFLSTYADYVEIQTIAGEQGSDPLFTGQMAGDPEPMTYE